MTTIVHFADLHLDTKFNNFRPEVARKRRQALRDVLAAIIDLALEVGADALFCGGDLYEHDMTAADTGDFLRSQFARLATVPVLIAPGNHDWLAPASIYRQTRWTPNVHIFEHDVLLPFELADGLTVWGGAHLVPANSPGFLDGFRVDRSGVNIGLFHGSLRSGLPFQDEGKQPHAPFDAEQISLSGLTHAFVGHYHKPSGDNFYTYPGNPDPLSFGEAGDRGAVVATIAADGSVTVVRRPVARTVADDVSVDLTDCTNSHEVFDRVKAALASRSGFVRVTLTGSLSDDVPFQDSDLQGLAPSLDGLVVKRDLRPAYDFDEIAQEPNTVRGQFVRDVRASDLDDDTKRRVLITGLRALREADPDLDVA